MRFLNAFGTQHDELLLFHFSTEKNRNDPKSAKWKLREPFITLSVSSQFASNTNRTRNIFIRIKIDSLPGAYGVRGTDANTSTWQKHEFFFFSIWIFQRLSFFFCWQWEFVRRFIKIHGVWIWMARNFYAFFLSFSFYCGMWQALWRFGSRISIIFIATLWPSAKNERKNPKYLN